MQHQTIRASYREIRMMPCGLPPPRDAFLDFDPILPGWPEVQQPEAQQPDGVERRAKRTPVANETRHARDGSVEGERRRHRAWS